MLQAIPGSPTAAATPEATSPIGPMVVEPGDPALPQPLASRSASRSPSPGRSSHAPRSATNLRTALDDFETRLRDVRSRLERLGGPASASAQAENLLGRVSLEVHRLILSNLELPDLARMRQVSRDVKARSDASFFIEAAHVLAATGPTDVSHPVVRIHHRPALLDYLERIDTALDHVEKLPVDQVMPGLRWSFAPPGEDAAVHARSFVYTGLARSLTPEGLYGPREGQQSFLPEHLPAVALVLRRLKVRVERLPSAQRATALVAPTTLAMHLDASRPDGADGADLGSIDGNARLRVERPAAEAADWLRDFARLGRARDGRDVGDIDKWVAATGTEDAGLDTSRLRLFDVPKTQGWVDAPVLEAFYAGLLNLASKFDAAVVRAFLREDPSRLRRFLHAGNMLRADIPEPDGKVEHLNKALEVFKIAGVDPHVVGITRAALSLLTPASVPEDLAPLRSAVQLMLATEPARIPGDAWRLALDSMLNEVSDPSVTFSAATGSEFTDICLTFAAQMPLPALRQSLRSPANFAFWDEIDIEMNAPPPQSMVLHSLPDRCHPDDRDDFAVRVNLVAARLAAPDDQDPD